MDLSPRLPRLSRLPTSRKGENIMNVQERLIERLRQLEPEVALRLYDLALSYRQEPEPADAVAIRKGAMERSRRALEKFTGSLADDVLSAREDRL